VGRSAWPTRVFRNGEQPPPDDFSGLTTRQRLEVLAQGLWHFTAAAPHADEIAHSTDFTRADAELALTMTASLLRRAAAVPLRKKVKRPRAGSSAGTTTPAAP